MAVKTERERESRSIAMVAVCQLSIKRLSDLTDNAGIMALEGEMSTPRKLQLE